MSTTTTDMLIKYEPPRNCNDQKDISVSLSDADMKPFEVFVESPLKPQSVSPNINIVSSSKPQTPPLSLKDADDQFTSSSCTSHSGNDEDGHMNDSDSYSDCSDAEYSRKSHRFRSAKYKSRKRSRRSRRHFSSEEVRHDHRRSKYNNNKSDRGYEHHQRRSHHKRPHHSANIRRHRKSETFTGNNNNFATGVNSASSSSLIDYNALAAKCARSMVNDINMCLISPASAANDKDYRITPLTSTASPPISEHNSSRHFNPKQQSARISTDCSLSPPEMANKVMPDLKPTNPSVEPYVPDFPGPRPLLPFRQRFKMPNFNSFGPPPPPPPPSARDFNRPHFFRFPPPPLPLGGPFSGDFFRGPFPSCQNNNNLLYLTGNSPHDGSRNFKRRASFGASNYTPKRLHNRSAFTPNRSSGPFSSVDELPNKEGKSDLPKPVSKMPKTYDDSVLFLRRVPIEMNKMELLNQYFSKFGTVCNIEIGHQNDPESAMVKFFNADQARTAFRSPEAVFNNRFIKLYWGSIGRSVLTKKAIRKDNNDNECPPKLSPVKAAKPVTLPQTPSSVPVSTAVTTLPMKNISVTEREMLIQQTNEEYTQLSKALLNQKQLLAKLGKVSTADEKTSNKEMLKLAMYHIKGLQKSLELKQSLIKQAQRTVKVNVDRKRPPSVSSNHSDILNDGGLNIQVSSEEEDEECLPPPKRHRLNDSSSTSSGT